MTKHISENLDEFNDIVNAVARELIELNDGCFTCTLAVLMSAIATVKMQPGCTITEEAILAQLKLEFEDCAQQRKEHMQ